MNEEKNWTYNFKESLWDVPTKPGVYLIIFENGKRYVGSTNNIRKRLVNHLGCLCGKNHDTTKWYKLAREENSLPQYKPIKVEPKKGKRKSIKEIEEEIKEENRKFFQFLRQVIINKISISFCVCDDYGEYEDQLLKSIKEKDIWYNSQFYGNNKRRER